MCNFPFTGNNCTITYRQYLINNNYYENYLLEQLLYLIGGSLFFLISCIQFYRMIFNKKKIFQKFVHFVCCVVSFTFLIRGIDPKSYSGIIPLYINQLSWDISTCLLYAILFVLIFEWHKLLHRYNERLLILFRNILIITFSFISLVSIIMSLLQSFLHKEESLVRSIKLILCAFVLSSILIFVNSYNYKLLKILSHFSFRSKQTKIALMILFLNLVVISAIIFQIITIIRIFTNNIYNATDLPENGISISGLGIIQFISVFFLLLFCKNISEPKDIFFYLYIRLKYKIIKIFNCKKPLNNQEIELVEINN